MTSTTTTASTMKNANTDRASVVAEVDGPVDRGGGVGACIVGGCIVGGPEIRVAG